MNQILFIQGGGANVHEQWDAKLVESLSRELGPAYEIRYPRMPNEGDPSFATWHVAIEHAIDALDNGAIVVGHSAGGTILINTLAQWTPKVSLAAIMLISTPFIGKGGWPSDDIEPRSDLEARLPRDTPVFVYHGDADAIVPISHASLYADALPRARVRRLAGRDHQLDNDLADVVNDIRDLESS